MNPPPPLPSRPGLAQVEQLMNYPPSFPSLLPPPGLVQVEQWITAAGAEFVGDSWEELRFIRQVGGIRGRGAGLQLVYPRWEGGCGVA